MERDVDNRGVEHDHKPSQAQEYERQMLALHALHSCIAHRAYHHVPPENETCQMLSPRCSGNKPGSVIGPICTGAGEGTRPSGSVPCQLTPCWLIEIDDVVGMGIDARGVLAELRELCSMPLQEGIKVCLGSPVCIVDDTSAVCAFVQCCPDVARLIPHLFGEANPLIDECLLLLRGRLKDVDQCDQVALFGNTHMFLLYTMMHER